MPDHPAVPTAPDRAQLQAEVVIHSQGWGDVEPLVQKCFDTVLKMEIDGVTSGAATVVLADDALLRELNRDFRGLDKPTNVLSFPAEDMPGLPVALASMGDIILARETCVAEATAGGLSVDHHLAHLIIHGLLHLAGFDHEAEAEAEIMEAVETQVLAKMGIADPYRPVLEKQFHD